MKIDPNANAFPAMYPNAEKTGLTIRAYFAAMAADPDASDIREIMAWEDVPLGDSDDIESDDAKWQETGAIRWHKLTIEQRLACVAQFRVRWADALIAALNAEPAS